MKKIKQFIKSEFHQWELWLYFVVLPVGMLVSVAVGGILGLIYK